jgi:hypothetical protein
LYLKRAKSIFEENHNGDIATLTCNSARGVVHTEQEDPEQKNRDSYGYQSEQRGEGRAPHIFNRLANTVRDNPRQ